MEILDLKDLEKVIKLARKAGIKTLRVGEIEFTLSESYAPATARPRGKSAAAKIIDKSTAAKLDTKELSGELTPEQLLFWSANYSEIEDLGSES
jgi:hypothetical protein